MYSLTDGYMHELMEGIQSNTDTGIMPGGEKIRSLEVTLVI